MNNIQAVKKYGHEFSVKRMRLNENSSLICQHKIYFKNLASFVQ